MGTILIGRICDYSRILIRLFIEQNKLIIRTAAVDLAHKIHGKSLPGGKHTFVLHGFLGSKKNWQSMSKRIASELNTCAVAVDARNHGDSPHVKSHTYLELASDVSRLMDKLSIKTADMIGHSMGGRTAMVLALTQPDKVSRLIVVDISPVSTAGILNDFFPRLIDVLKTIQFKGAVNVNQARNVAKDKILASGVMSSMEGMDFILMNLAVKPDKTIGWMINLDTLRQSFQDIATFPKDMENKMFDGPTLFIGGEESNYLPLSDLDGIRRMFPKAQLKYVPKVGHNVHAEDPQTFFSFVKDFMSS